MDESLFKPSSELTFDTVQGDCKRLEKHLRDCKVTSFCLDLRDVTQCDSAGLALLIEAKRLGKQYQKTIVMSSVPKAIYALAEFCGVEAVLANDVIFG